MTASGGDSAPEVGAPDGWKLPEGLDSITAKKAVDIVIDWEQSGDGLAIDLVCRLYAEFMIDKRSS